MPHINGVVLAGSYNQSGLETVSDEVYEALIPLAGKRLIEYVMQALEDARRIDERFVVGFPEFEDCLDFSRSTLLQAGETFIDSIRAGLEASSRADYLLFVTADIPLITGEILDIFVDCAQQTKADLCVPVVTKAVSEAKYPQVQRTYARIGGESLTLGNAFFGTAETIERILPRLERLYALRKRIFRLALTVGPGLLLRLITGTATLEQLEKRFEKLIGARGRALISPYPELALDIDKPSHLVAVEQLLDVPDA